MQDALVVGGGIVGETVAFRLAQAGLATTILSEPRATPPASWGNAGHIALEQTAPLASPAMLRQALGKLFLFGGPLDFRAADIAHWAPWARRFLGASTPAQFARGHQALSALLALAGPAWRKLATALGDDDLYRECGHIIFWESAKTAENGRVAWSRQSASGVRMRAAEGADMAPFQSILKRSLFGGIAFEGTGQVSSPGLVLDALRNASPCTRIAARGTKLVIRAGQAELVADSRERFRAGLVVIAAGVGSGALLEQIREIAPVIAERGYHVEGDAGDWPLHAPPIVFEDRSLIVTRFGTRLRAASFTEFAEAASPPDARKWRRLQQHIDALGIPLGGDVRCWMGARPTLPDYLPAIGRSARADNLLYAFGHQHLGLTLAPITAEIVAALAVNQAPTLDLAPFRLGRFAPTHRRPS